jgi:hypothetical protein
VRAAPGPRAEVERCDGCGRDLPAEHEHVVEAGGRALRCTCHACAVMLAAPWKRVRPSVTPLPALLLTDATWTALGVPIGLAFFVRRAQGVLAFYPSPAGVIESPVAPEAWNALISDNPELGDLEADTETLLVNRLAGARAHYRVSVDHGYRLAGLVRLHWRGLGGGPALASELRRFFAELDRG